MSYGGFARGVAPQGPRPTIDCSSCGEPMVGPRSRNKGRLKLDGEIIPGSHRLTDPVGGGTCSRCVTSVTVGRRKADRLERRAAKKQEK